MGFVRINCSAELTTWRIICSWLYFLSSLWDRFLCWVPFKPFAWNFYKTKIEKFVLTFYWNSLFLKCNTYPSITHFHAAVKKWWWKTCCRRHYWRRTSIWCDSREGSTSFAPCAPAKNAWNSLCPSKHSLNHPCCFSGIGRIHCIVTHEQALLVI